MKEPDQQVPKGMANILFLAIVVSIFIAKMFVEKTLA